MNYQKPKAKRTAKLQRFLKTSFYLKLQSENYSGWRMGERKLYSSTPTFEKKQITQKVLLGEEVSLKEMTAELCNNHFGGMKYGLGTPSHGFASSCFIEYFI